MDIILSIEQHTTDKVRLTNFLRQILSEDKELLEKLAQ